MPTAHQHRTQLALLGFVILYPLCIFPQYVLTHSKTELFVPQGEVIHLFPRLGLLLAMVLVCWRFVSARSPFAWLMLGALGLAALSSLIAGDPDGLMFVLGGPQNRMDGLLYQVLATALALIAFRVFDTSQTRQQLVWALLISASLQAGLVVLQRFGLDILGLLAFGNKSLITTGSMGHYGVVAGLLFTALLVSAPLGMVQTSRPLRVVAWFALGLIAAALGFTGTKAAMYATLAVLALTLALRFSPTRLALYSWIVLCIFLPQNLLPNPLGFKRSYLDTSTGSSRLEIWKLGFKVLQTIRGAPWIGGGSDALLVGLLRDLPPEAQIDFLRLENRWPANAELEKVSWVVNGPKLRDRVMSFEFAQYGEEKDVTKLDNVPLDKAHNFLLDRLLSYGGLHVLLLIALYGLAIWKGLRGTDTFAFATAGAMLGVFIYYLAWFPVVQLEPLLLILLAALWAANSAPRSHSEPVQP